MAKDVGFLICPYTIPSRTGNLRGKERLIFGLRVRPKEGNSPIYKTEPPNRRNFGKLNQKPSGKQAWLQTRIRAVSLSQ